MLIRGYSLIDNWKHVSYTGSALSLLHRPLSSQLLIDSTFNLAISLISVNQAVVLVQHERDPFTQRSTTNTLC